LLILESIPVDYILFLTADVDVTPNENEIRDHKYVSKEELQAMFEDPGTFGSICTSAVPDPFSWISVS